MPTVTADENALTRLSHAETTRGARTVTHRLALICTETHRAWLLRPHPGRVPVFHRGRQLAARLTMNAGALLRIPGNGLGKAVAGATGRPDRYQYLHLWSIADSDGLEPGEEAEFQDPGSASRQRNRPLCKVLDELELPLGG